jgi:hypothetical protein
MPPVPILPFLDGMKKDRNVQFHLALVNPTTARIETFFIDINDKAIATNAKRQMAIIARMLDDNLRSNRRNHVVIPRGQVLKPYMSLI